MIVENALGPTEDQVKQMQAPGPDQPICLVNMLKYREHAQYPDGRDTSLTGKQAYEIYAKSVEKMLPTYDGKLTFVGDVTYLRMGVVEELWDEIVIVMYPSRSHMRKMTMSEEWKEASVHRIAGLEGQLNIETIQSANFSEAFS